MVRLNTFLFFLPLHTARPWRRWRRLGQVPEVVRLLPLADRQVHRQLHQLRVAPPPLLVRRHLRLPVPVPDSGNRSLHLDRHPHSGRVQTGSNKIGMS